MLPESPQVLIVGGGPCGLMLANELGRRGVAALLLDQKPGTAFNPQANATQARTMEHYRRMAFADEIRALGMPADFPTDIAYFTRFAKHELARFRLPSAREARQLVSTLSGSWSAAELPHRVAQKFVEQVLRRHAERVASVHYGWRVTHFTDHGDYVEAEAEPVEGGKSLKIRSAYLVGADGARSIVRQAMGWRHTGETGVTRDFVGGRMYAVYCRVPDFYREVPHAPAWMNVSFNRERRCFMPAIAGKDQFAFHTPPNPPEDEARIDEGAEARKRAGAYLEAHGRAEFNIPGITFGGRYDGSPAIIGDGSAPPPETMNTYVPTACPGGRPPHVWLPDGRSLYDLFGFEWTLLCLNDAPALEDRHMQVVPLQNGALRELYGADYALIRPDQIVAWRGNSAAAARAALERLHG